MILLTNSHTSNVWSNFESKMCVIITAHICDSDTHCYDQRLGDLPFTADIGGLSISNITSTMPREIEIYFCNLHGTNTNKK